MGRSLSKLPADILVTTALAYGQPAPFGAGRRQTFTTSGSFTVPSGVTALRAMCLGPGGVGGTNNN